MQPLAPPVVDRTGERISDEEITRALCDGSGFENGKLRIQYYFSQPVLPTMDETVHWLKKEYGIGGRSWELADGSQGWLDYNSKGFEIQCTTDVDRALERAVNWSTFVLTLNQMGYEVAYGRNIKYAKLRPKGSPRAIRFKSLGPGYSEQELRERLEQPKSDTSSRREQREQAVPLVYKKVRFHGYYRKHDHKKITGFMALYYHYLYLFGKVQKRRTSSRKTHFLLWEDFRTFERYKQQAQFLWQNRIQTTDDLHHKRQEVTAKMEGLIARRQALYKLRSNTANGLNKAGLSQQIQALTEELRGLRKELRYCDTIEQDAEHLRKQVENIAVTVIDLVHFKGHYNPLVYLETDEDAMKLAHAIVHNTKPKDAVGSADQFWDNSSIMLISAIILYLLYEAPAEEQNLSTVMYMILNGQVSEDESYPAPLAMLFNDLEDREPDHPAVLQYKSFLLGSTKTLQSVLVTAASNLHMFNSEQFAYMTGRDETFLPELGLQKRVIFCVIPDNDETYNFLITMLYTQIFDQLFRLADSNPEYKGALPVHVRLMMDEFANVALPKDFKKILSVCRSRNISCDIILQSIAQLKSLFKDDWEGIVGNCDSLLYLGGNEYGTFEYLSKILGKETERTVSHSIGRGSHGSSSESQQKAARDLATPDEIRRMSNNDALLLLRSEDPVVDRKYDLLKHPNIKMTTDGGAAPYVMPYDFMQMAVSISQKELATIEPDKIPVETLDKYELIDLEEIENAA